MQMTFLMFLTILNTYRHLLHIRLINLFIFEPAVKLQEIKMIGRLWILA